MPQGTVTAVAIPLVTRLLYNAQLGAKAQNVLSKRRKLNPTRYE